MNKSTEYPRHYDAHNDLTPPVHPFLIYIVKERKLPCETLFRRTEDRLKEFLLRPPFVRQPRLSMSLSLFDQVFFSQKCNKTEIGPKTGVKWDLPFSLCT